MSRDTKSKMSKSETIKNKKKYEDVKQKKKIIESSDDESIYSDNDEEEEELDVHEYRKFLKDMFPSKHLENKIKAGERIKKYIKDE